MSSALSFDQAVEIETSEELRDIASKVIEAGFNELAEADRYRRLISESTWLGSSRATKLQNLLRARTALRDLVKAKAFYSGPRLAAWARPLQFEGNEVERIRREYAARAGPVREALREALSRFED